MHLNQLNGWQRSWFVLAVVWLFIAAWTTFQSFPTESQIRAVSEQQQRDAMKLKWKENDLARQHCWKISQDGDDLVAYGKCLATNGVGTKSGDARFRFLEDVADQALTIDLELLPKQQAMAALNGLLLWVLPLLALYALGLGIAWIRNGFKK